MAISQRQGTTETTVTHDTTTYSVDRFAIFDKIDGGNNFTYQQVTTPLPDDFSHALKIKTAIADTSIAADNYAFFYQVVESQNIQQANLGTSAAKPLTLSFHVYSNKTGTYTVGLNNYGSYNRTFLKEFTISAQNTWEKKTVTFPAITSGSWGDVRVQWCLVTGSNNQGAADTLLTSTVLGTSNQVNFADTVNNEFLITGVQLEVDSTGSGVATDFEHRSYGDELQRCSRYCQVMTSNATSERINFADVTVHGGGNGVYIFPGLLPMRTAPSVTTSGSFNANGLTGGWTQTAVSSIASEFTTANGNDRAMWGFDGMLSASLADSCTVGLSGSIFSSSGFGQFVFSAEL
tara:strand:- start:217 stop:1260 length:1044 start_codon:yes stop_codon:yes gene_type:complete